MNAHPSDYALDRAALGAPAPDVSAHLARCVRCAEALAARRAPVEPPAWLASVRVGPARRRRWRWTWLLPVPLVAATAAALLAVQGGTLRGGVDATRAKGSPRVAVFVKHGDAVAAWDGRSAIHPGDRLQLSVHGAGYAQLSVASLSPRGDVPAVLWAGPLATDGDTVPPLSFRADAEGSREILSVILSARPVAPWQHVGDRPPGAWSVRIEIPKEDAR